MGGLEGGGGGYGPGGMFDKTGRFVGGGGGGFGGAGATGSWGGGTSGGCYRNRTGATCGTWDRR